MVIWWAVVYGAIKLYCIYISEGGVNIGITCQHQDIHFNSTKEYSFQNDKVDTTAL